MDKNRNLYQLLEDSAEKFASATALVFRDKKISYSGLLSATTDLRAILSTHGISASDRVAIYTNKSIDFVTAQFAILGCGAAYLPVDFSAPAERNKYIVDNCEAKAIIAGKNFSAMFSGNYKTVAELGNGLQLLLRNSACKASPEGLAYILYTSGSTGKPKGVMYSHAGALAFVDWSSKTFSPSEKDIFSSHAPFHFDLSIFDLFVSIRHGATLVLIDEETAKQPMLLAKLISEEKISTWYSTPTILNMLASFGKMQKYNYDSLKLVLFAGEVFPVGQFQNLKEYWKTPAYYNLYGPTETNVCTYYKLPGDISGLDNFPIGKPCQHYESMIAENGELYIHGNGVMLGYWNSGEQTNNAFHRDAKGKNWYKTGDLVELNEKKELVYKGRIDRMVKRNGYRIELPEIEAALHKHPAVRENAVISKPNSEGGTVITAFVACNSGEEASIVKMKEYCIKNLPVYMIPDNFIFLESLPQTASNKTDYQSLKQMI